MRDSTKKYAKFVGETFGRLKILELYRDDDNDLSYKCLCSCSKNIVSKKAYGIIYQGTKSCGCIVKEIRGKSSITHGLSNHPLFDIWNAMMQRCYNSKHRMHKHYGGRGIIVCDRWHNPENFIDDMSPRPYGLELDRIDNNGNYEPNNCRWATEIQQMNNFRRNRWIEFNGEKMTLTNWSRKIGIREQSLIWRLDVAKWPIERALTLPNRESNK